MFTPSRRALLGGAALLATGSVARAQVPPADETIRLWPGAPPGRGGDEVVPKTVERSTDPTLHNRIMSGISTPRLIVRRPARPDGSAVLMIPGGGYAFLAFDEEGVAPAAWLAGEGATVFILLHRLPSEGWGAGADAPLQDAQRAMRLIRANAGRYGIDPARVAVMGFSAGGHLAGSLATRHAAGVYPPVDRVDALSARPDLAALAYPVVSVVAPFSHVDSGEKLLGPGASTERKRLYSVEANVDQQTPPIFLVHAADDGLVPVDNSLALFAAMRAQKRPAELHVFEEGGHAFGVHLPETMPVAHWTALFTTFARRKGLLAAVAR